MKILFSLILLSCAPAWAQTRFSAPSLPSQVGQSFRSYYSTNVDAGPLLVLSTGPQRWDFSQPQQPSETILRTDIIAPADGEGGGSFPNAGYSERDTLEPNNQIAWRYYGITAQGRLYYGFDNPVDLNATSLVVFDQPTLDVPASVQYGQTWNRIVTWRGTVLGILPMNYYFTATATVDAYGTLILPSIGGVPALRVHEIHDYEASEPSGGGSSTPISSQTNQFYYWLVPGLGVAAQVLLFGNNELFPVDLPNTNAVLRVFQASYFTGQAVPVSVNGLRIHLQGRSALLDWLASTPASTYRIEASGSLANQNWQLLGLPTSNSWSDTVTTTQRFYRVFTEP